MEETREDFEWWQVRQSLEWLNNRVWLSGVTLHSIPQRLPARPRWVAIANEMPGAFARRYPGTAEEQGILSFRCERDTLPNAVAALCDAVAFARYPEEVVRP